MTDQGYARPEMLTTSEWLAAHLQDANLRLVDCDNRDAYRRAHIPGAITFRGHHYLKEKEGALHIMGPEQFAETMGALGIGNDTQVIVLNCGWDKWLTEGRPVTMTEPRPPQASFTPRVQEQFLARWDYVQD